MHRTSVTVRLLQKPASCNTLSCWFHAFSQASHKFRGTPRRLRALTDKEPCMASKALERSEAPTNLRLFRAERWATSSSVRGSSRAVWMPFPGKAPWTWLGNLRSNQGPSCRSRFTEAPILIGRKLPNSPTGLPGLLKWICLHCLRARGQQAPCSTLLRKLARSCSAGAGQSQSSSGLHYSGPSALPFWRAKVRLRSSPVRGGMSGCLTLSASPFSR